MSSSIHESLSGAVDVPFPEYEKPPPDPIPLLRAWLTLAETARVREPRAVALATATLRGRSSVRMVYLRDLTDSALIFETHSTSRKGREVAESGWASGLLYWRERGQQIMFAGETRPLSALACDALWAARPAPLHAMTSASHQSDPLLDVDALRNDASRYLASNARLPRPPRFVGYSLTPFEVEFWAASSDRLHRRLKYQLCGDGWAANRLQP